ncbi:MAG: 50S ribosomal protein L29 [Deltaproteobacteria bacterium]|jgi:large subunit ribosomal protein L29|nr:50S ribosomal protein L29 [Deltaproteobacteria bacterium]MBW2696671.1 50S ribosomal protein L29 [Deltaproteobacteria bacterium]
MNVSEIRELAVKELATKVRETRDELFNAKVKHATGQLEDTAKLARLRRDIARLETVLQEKREATQ